MTNHTPTFPQNISDYAPWVATYGLLAPYGKCQCGCGQETLIAKWRNKEYGLLGGHPQRFIHTHRTPEPLEDRFWKKVVKKSDGECWLWKGAISKRVGYGNMRVNESTQLAHRVSWEIHNGSVPDGLNVLHRCDNRQCVNPNHLFVGTQSENVQDMYAKGREPNRKGEKQARHKITEDAVREIRRRYEAGEFQTALAREFKLRQSHISSIVRGLSWGHVR